jgi:hypothetical protein
MLSWYGIYQICRALLPEKRVPAKTQPAPTVAIMLLALALSWGLPLLASSPQENSPAVASVQLPNGKKALPSDLLGLFDSAKQQSSADSANTNLQAIGLKDLGLAQGIEMRGPHAFSSVNFTLSHTLVPRHAAHEDQSNGETPRSAANGIGLNARSARGRQLG